MAISKKQEGLERRRFLALLYEGEATEAKLLARYKERWPKASGIGPGRLSRMLDDMEALGLINAWTSGDGQACPTCGHTSVRRLPRPEWEWALEWGTTELFEFLGLLHTLDGKGR